MKEKYFVGPERRVREKKQVSDRQTCRTCGDEFDPRGFCRKCYAVYANEVRR